MVRTQIELPDRLHRELKALAAAENMTLREFSKRVLGEAVSVRRHGRTAGKNWTFPVVRDMGRVLLPESEWRAAATERPVEDHLPGTRKRT